MNFFHCILISAQCLFVLPVFGNQSETRDNAALVWGSSVEGFQMATSLDATSGIIHCWIRNATTNALDYSFSDVGHYGFVTLDIRVETNWISLIPWIFPSGEDSNSNSAYYAKAIKPKHIITYAEDLLDSTRKVINGRDTLMLRASMATGLEGPDRVMYTNMVQAINTRWTLLTNLCYGDTFALDFVIKNTFVIEGFTNQAVVTARVTQKLRLDSGRKMFILTSPEFKCPVFKYDCSLLKSSRHGRVKY